MWVCLPRRSRIPSVCRRHHWAWEHEPSPNIQQTSSKTWWCASLKVKPRLPIRSACLLTDTCSPYKSCLARFFLVHVSGFLSHAAYMVLNVFPASDITSLKAWAKRKEQQKVYSQPNCSNTAIKKTVINKQSQNSGWALLQTSTINKTLEQKIS